MTRLTLASTALLCALVMGWPAQVRAQAKAIDNHGTWVFDFKPKAKAGEANRSRRPRSARNPARSRNQADTLVRFADADGRRYNPSSKVWFDGQGSCWSGREVFTFKKGAWFYGDAVWAPSDTGWLATEAAQPELVSCDSDPAFAANARELAATATTSSATGPSATVAPRAEPQKAGAKTGCKKYFASVGQMLTVPCGD